MVADLSSSTLESVANAVDAFEEEKGLILCHIRPSTFSKLVPLFSVPQGYYALVQRGGKFADYGEDGSPVWPPGLHFGVLKHVSGNKQPSNVDENRLQLVVLTELCTMLCLQHNTSWKPKVRCTVN